jgi:hypothetical protein
MGIGPPITFHKWNLWDQKWRKWWRLGSHRSPAFWIPWVTAVFGSHTPASIPWVTAVFRFVGLMSKDMVFRPAGLRIQLQWQISPSGMTNPSNTQAKECSNSWDWSVCTRMFLPSLHHFLQSVSHKFKWTKIVREAMSFCRCWLLVVNDDGLVVFLFTMMFMTTAACMKAWREPVTVVRSKGLITVVLLCTFVYRTQSYYWKWLFLVTFNGWCAVRQPNWSNFAGQLSYFAV